MNRINGFWFFTLSILSLFLLVSIVRLPPLDDFFALNKDNSLGDAFNGLTAPFIGLISAYLLYRALMAQNETNRLQTQALEMQRKEFELTVAAQNETNRLQTQALNMQSQEFESVNIASALGRVDAMISNFQYREVENGEVLIKETGVMGIRAVMIAVSKRAPEGGRVRVKRLESIPQMTSLAFIFRRILNIDSTIKNANIPDIVKSDFDYHVASYGKLLSSLAGQVEFFYDGDREDPLYLDFKNFWERFREDVYNFY